VVRASPDCYPKFPISYAIIGALVSIYVSENSIDATVHTGRAARRDWIGLAVLSLPCLLVSMDLTILNLAVPQISADLKPSASQLLWIVDIYGFLIAGSLITMGTLGDRIGRRRLLLFGAAAFGVASVLAAFSRSAEMLIANRAVLGVAGATLMPSTLSLIRNMFHDPDQRKIAIGIWTTCFAVGGVIGPLLGGALLEHFWWGSAFLLSVPVMLLLLVLGPLLLPEFRDPQMGRFDIGSAGLSLVAVLAVIYGIKRIAEGGLGGAALASIVFGIGIAILFTRRQKKLADPLIDLDLFRHSAFSVSLATNILGFFVTMGVFLHVAQYLQLVLGLSPLHAGLWMVPASAGFTAGSMLSPIAARYVRPQRVMGAGLAIAAIGFAVITQADGVTGLSYLVGGTTLFCMGLAPAYILATDMIIASAPPERAGMASAMSETATEFGAALGIAILGSIGTAVYRVAMSDVRSAIPADAMDAARSTLGAAVAIGARFSGESGDELINAARVAFTRSLELTASISIVIVVATAFAVVLLLRPRR
jgi:DHA2 family multidrug resistance protein-like MFS transporter